MRFPSIALPILLTACGKKGDPLPPLVRVPARVEEIQIAQRGAFIHLEWQAPDHNADGSLKVVLKEAEILRRVVDVAPPPEAVPAKVPEVQAPVEAATPKAAPAPKTFEEEAQVVARIEVPAAGGAVFYRDPWDPAWDGKRLEYALRHRNRRGRPSQNSPLVSLEPRPPLPAPQGLSAAAADGFVELCWDEESPSAFGFDVYRRADGLYEKAPLNDVPLPVPRFEDKTAVFGAPSCYQLKKVALALSRETGEGEWQRLRPAVESPESAEVCLTPIDTFPPPAPTDLVAAAAQEGILLSWKEVTVPDRRGYRVYRGTSGDGAFELLTTETIEAPSFTDKTAAPGQTYYYAVSAIDRETPPNEGPKSRPASPRAPRPN